MPDQPTSAGTTPRLERIASFAEAKHEWTDLAQAGGDIFSTWEWASIWWRHFGAGELDLTGCRGEDGELLAILPLFRRRIGPLRVTRLVGYPVGSRAHPVCAPSNRTSAALGLIAALKQQKTDLFIGEGLPEDEHWAEQLPGTTVVSVPSPTLLLTPFETWDDYLETRSSNFRQDIRRKERKLLRDNNDVVYRLATDRDRLESDVDAFFALHADRWTTGSSLLETSRIAFHREFARIAFDRGWLRLWFLELAGEPAAAWYGFRFGEVETYYQAGRAPAHADGSLGVVLLAHTIREALGGGVDEYRFGPGGSSYKYRFTDTDPGLRTVLIPTTRRGRLAVSANALTRRSAVLRRSAAKLARRS